jgi:hypothetical protein
VSERLAGEAGAHVPTRCDDHEPYGPGAVIATDVPSPVLYATGHSQVVAVALQTGTIVGDTNVRWRLRSDRPKFKRQSPLVRGDYLFFSWRDPGTIVRVKRSAMNASADNDCGKTQLLESRNEYDPIALFRVSGTISFSTPALMPDIPGRIPTLLSGEHKGGSCLFALDLRTDYCPHEPCIDGAYWDDVEPSHNRVYRLKRKWDFHQPPPGVQGFFSSGASSSDGKTYYIGSNDGVFWALKNHDPEPTDPYNSVVDPRPTCHVAGETDLCTNHDDWKRIRWCYRTADDVADFASRVNCGNDPTSGPTAVPEASHGCVPADNVPLPGYTCDVF